EAGSLQLMPKHVRVWPDDGGPAAALASPAAGTQEAGRPILRRWTFYPSNVSCQEPRAYPVVQVLWNRCSGEPECLSTIRVYHPKGRAALPLHPEELELPRRAVCEHGAAPSTGALCALSALQLTARVKLSASETGRTSGGCGLPRDGDPLLHPDHMLCCVES